MTNQFSDLCVKVVKVITSSKNLGQIKVAKKFMYLANKKMPDKEKMICDNIFWVKKNHLTPIQPEMGQG